MVTGHANTVIVRGRLLSISSSKTGEYFSVIAKTATGTQYLRFKYNPAHVNIDRFRMHSRIAVEGHVEDGDRLYADSASKEETLISKSFPDMKGIFFQDMEATAIISGTVKAVRTLNDKSRAITVLLDVPENGNSLHEASFWLKKLDKPLDIRPGDTVCAHCLIASKKADRPDGTYAVLTRLAADDIAVISTPERERSLYEEGF